MQEIDFFNYLLNQTEEAYQKTDIQSKNLSYAVTATKLKKSAPLILGFNWGASKDVPYTKQVNYPAYDNFDQITDKGSLKRTSKYFLHYYPEALKAVQSNFCFFRSKEEKHISKKDVALSIPLFEELIDFLQPHKIVCFSSRLRNFFLENNKLTNVQKKVFTLDNYNRSVFVVLGDYKIREKNIEFIYLPHPNYHIKGELREQAWKSAFRK